MSVKERGFGSRDAGRISNVFMSQISHKFNRVKSRGQPSAPLLPADQFSDGRLSGCKSSHRRINTGGSGRGADDRQQRRPVTMNEERLIWVYLRRTDGQALRRFHLSHYVHVPIDARPTFWYVRGTLKVDRLLDLKRPDRGATRDAASRFGR